MSTPVGKVSVVAPAGSWKSLSDTLDEKPVS
jgi:hypothetical protein